MSGIILLIVLGVWIFLANVIAKYFLSRMKLDAGKKKTFAHIGLFILIFIAPVADDIIGGFQFRAMCTPENMLIYDAEKVRGKSLQYKKLGRQKITAIIPITQNTTELVDPATGEVLITHRTYYAKGGWLSRFIGFPEGSPPYTFVGTCRSKEFYELFKKLNVTELKGYYGE